MIWRKYNPDPLEEGERQFLARDVSLEAQDMPASIRLEIPDWAEGKLAERFGGDVEPQMRAFFKELV